MQALHQEILPPSGVEYAATLKLTPATLADSAVPSTSTSYPHSYQGALYNVVVARANILRIFEVTETTAPMPPYQDERNRRTDAPRGSEAAEGEVEMDTQGEGFVNMGSVKVTLNIYVDDSPLPMTVIYLFLSPPILVHGRQYLKQLS
jgi:cleavage and polyadenylation specificity factor subunit 1